MMTPQQLAQISAVASFVLDMRRSAVMRSEDIQRITGNQAPLTREVGIQIVSHLTKCHATPFASAVTFEESTGTLPRITVIIIANDYEAQQERRKRLPAELGIDTADNPTVTRTVNGQPVH